MKTWLMALIQSLVAAAGLVAYFYADNALLAGVAAAAAAARKQVQAATKRAAPKDIVDIIVSEPIMIRVKPAEAK